jgi:SAM-dependent methyltransferase
VLDFGCGLGWQATALAHRSIARKVIGLDIRLTELAEENAARYGVQDRVRFTQSLGSGEQFDLAYSCSSFEHFAEPEKILRLMLDATKPGGHVVVTFAEPWFSPHGAHMDGITKLPWVNLLFPERVVLSVRSRYRNDGARRYEEYEGGLNRMTLRKFERIMRSSGARVIYRRYIGVKGLPLVTKVPVVRELMTSSAAMILQKP